jgi:hypothetical protein
MDQVRAREIDATEQALRSTLDDMAALAVADGVPAKMLVQAWNLADRLTLALDAANDDGGDDELDAARRKAANLAAQLMRIERRLTETVHH